MSEQSGKTGDPGPPEEAPSYPPPAAGTPPEAPGQLEPGRGAPLVTGPPRSVTDPIASRKVNTVFGIGGVLAILAIIIVVVLVGLLLISLLSHH